MPARTTRTMLQTRNSCSGRQAGPPAVCRPDPLCVSERTATERCRRRAAHEVEQQAADDCNAGRACPLKGQRGSLEEGPHALP